VCGWLENNWNATKVALKAEKLTILTDVNGVVEKGKFNLDCAALISH